LPRSIIAPAKGAAKAIIKLGIVSISFTRNSAFGRYENAIAILGKAGEIAETDITVRLLANRSIILLFLPREVMVYY